MLSQILAEDVERGLLLAEALQRTRETVYLRLRPRADGLRLCAVRFRDAAERAQGAHSRDLVLEAVLDLDRLIGLP